MNVLVVAAHPDDETLGCGATIARLASEGHGVHVVVMARGLAARGPTTDEEFESLRDQSRQVASALGVQSIHHHDFPDNEMDSVSLLTVVKAVESEIERVSPSAVFTHHASDLNIDHRIVAQAVMTATRPMEGTGVTDVYCWETASATEWSFGQTGLRFEPNVFVDIEGFLTRKLEAMLIYEAEVRTYPHPRSAEALQAAAHNWGRTVGVRAAEAFQLVRSVRRDSTL